MSEKRVVSAAERRRADLLVRATKTFIAGHTDGRAPKVDAFTESFPARILSDVSMPVSFDASPSF